MNSNKQSELDKMTPEELGRLFPVIISEPNFQWKVLFEIEKTQLKRILADKAIQVEHFGSTAISNLKAKPTIDILVEIPKSKKVKAEILITMQSEGYHFIPRNDCPPPYVMFVKGYTKDGFKGQAYHIHMAEKEHTGLWDRLYFRDFLIANKEVAREYEILKQDLAKKYKNDREAYTEGKSEFVKRITEMAKRKKK